MAGTLGNKYLSYLKKKTNIAALLEETGMDFYPASEKTPSDEMRISLLIFLETLRALNDTVDEVEPKAFSLEQTKAISPIFLFLKKSSLVNLLDILKKKNNV